jgi:hypothetical protein
MEILHWITNHGTGLLESGGIIGSLLFTAVTLHRDARSRHTANLITLTAQHRDIWERFYDKPHLSRIRNPKVNLKRQPPTRDETLFVNLLILHLNCRYQAIKRDEITRPEGLGMDVGAFYSLPIPHYVWQQRKNLHDSDFVAFVDHAIAQIDLKN